MKAFVSRSAGALVVAAAGFGMPAVSSAFVVNSATALNSTFAVNYLLAQGATDPNGNSNGGQAISGSVLFTLLSFDTATDVIRLQLDVSNTSANLGNEVGIQKLAFGTDPNATGVTFTQFTGTGQTEKFIAAQLGADNEVANAVKPLLLDVQSETGVGAGNRLLEGMLDKFYLDISFASIDAGVAFSPFSSKWQTGYGSYEFGGNGGGSGGNGGGSGGNGGSVPEPSSLALVGIALLGFAAIRRRQRS